MSVVVAVTCPGGVWVGYDLAVSVGEERDLDDSKAFLASGVGIGTAGDARLSQLLRYGFEWKLPKRGGDLREWCCKTFVPDFQALLRASKPKIRDFSVMLALHGEVLTLGEDMVVSKSMHGYAAIGSGISHSLGSLATTESLIADNPRQRCELAVASAARHRGDIEVLGTPPTFWVPA